VQHFREIDEDLFDEVVDQGIEGVSWDGGVSSRLNAALV
jgi:hypothetical protein